MFIHCTHVHTLIFFFFPNTCALTMSFTSMHTNVSIYTFAHLGNFINPYTHLPYIYVYPPLSKTPIYNHPFATPSITLSIQYHLHLHIFIFIHTTILRSQFKPKHAQVRFNSFIYCSSCSCSAIQFRSLSYRPPNLSN